MAYVAPAGGLESVQRDVVSSPARSAWNLRCFRRGRHGELTLADERVEGTVAGLDADGALMVGERRLALHDALDLLH